MLEPGTECIKEERQKVLQWLEEEAKKNHKETDLVAVNFGRRCYLLLNVPPNIIK